MREQLIQYVKLLFAGASGVEDIQQEILQNTLDRYDDLISQGKSPEAAYRLAISGIGDINEILGGEPAQSIPHHTEQPSYAAPEDVREDQNNKLRRAIAVAMYILCPVPLLLLGNHGDGTAAVSVMFILIAGATVLIMLSKGPQEHEETHYSPKQALRKSISTVIWCIGLAVYLLLSFFTNAWFITWLVFPITGCVRRLVNACIDLVEADNHEN